MTQAKPTSKSRSKTPMAGTRTLSYRDFGLKQATEARLLGVGQKLASSLRNGQKPTPPVQRKIAEAERLLNALAELINVEAIPEWLGTPNDGFGGFKPVELIERGEVDELWRFIFMLGSGEPM